MTGPAPASRPVPTEAAPVGTAEARGNLGVPDRPDLSRPELREIGAGQEDAGGIRDWLARLPPLAQDVAAEERAAIQAEGCGMLGSLKPATEHAAEVAALVRGYDTHRQVSQMISENPGREGMPGASGYPPKTTRARANHLSGRHGG